MDSHKKFKGLNHMIIAVIMAGGSGTRFWPLSRRSNPKQFLTIIGKKSLIQTTVDRLLPKIKLENIYIVTADSHVQKVKEHLPELNPSNIIVEPEGMNTAPAIALSALFLSKRYKPEDKMLVLPADSTIKNIPEYLKSIDIAKEAVEQDNLVVFGVKPSYPSTGYGYIEGGEKTKIGTIVKNFKEKPDLKTAKQFIKSGNYYWNAGMFMWKVGTILDAYAKYLPKVSSLLSEISSRWQMNGVDSDISNIYSKMPKIPVDIGIMEQAEKRIVIPVDFEWSDIGGWKTLFDLSEKDKNNNVLKCANKIIDTKNCFVHSEKFVALLGVKDLIVVDTSDVLMIAEQNKTEEVKNIVKALEDENKVDLL